MMCVLRFLSWIVNSTILGVVRYFLWSFIILYFWPSLFAWCAALMVPVEIWNLGRLSTGKYIPHHKTQENLSICETLKNVNLKIPQMSLLRMLVVLFIIPGQLLLLLVTEQLFPYSPGLPAYTLTVLLAIFIGLFALAKFKSSTL